MPLKVYKCTNKKCNHEEQEFFHTNEEIPEELPCSECECFMELPVQENLCQSKQLWGWRDPRGGNPGT